MSVQLMPKGSSDYWREMAKPCSDAATHIVDYVNVFSDEPVTLSEALDVIRVGRHFFRSWTDGEMINALGDFCKNAQQVFNV